MPPHLLESLINRLKQLPGTDIVFLNSEPKIRIVHIYNFENTLKIKLPVEYKQFLLHHNGGHPKSDRFDYTINNDKKSSSIAYFLSICDHDNFSLSHRIQIYKDKFSENMIPIAIDIYDNLILIELVTKQVHFWDHESNSIGFINNSFNKFLEELY